MHECGPLPVRRTSSRTAPNEITITTMTTARHAPLTLLSLLLVASASSQHQRIGYAEHVNSGQWDTLSQYVVTIDAQGRETIRQYNYFDQLTGNWNTAGLLTQTWTASGQIGSLTYVAFDPLQGTVLSRDSSVYAYDALDSLASVEHYTWFSGTWLLTRSVSVFRGATYAMDSILQFVHDGGMPTLRSRDRVTNDPMDRPIRIVTDTLGVVWVTTDSSTITYDTDGRVGQITEIDLFVPAEWGIRRTYSYDAQGFLDRVDHEGSPLGGVFELTGWTSFDPAGDGLYNTVDTAWDALAQEGVPVFRIRYEGASNTAPELVRATTLHAYPNPATDQVTLPDLGAGVMADLISQEGRVITSKRTDARGVLDIRDLAPGLYVVRVIAPTGAPTTTILLKH